MPAPDTPLHGGERILVIDDEADIRESLEMVLTMAGYDVSTAENGDAALAQANENAFDLAITDMRMPGLGGLDTLAALKQSNPALAVMVVTGYLSDKSEARCGELGIPVVRKPFQLDEFLHVVEVALRDGRGLVHPARRRS